MHALRKKTSALASYKLITEINTICKTEEHSSQNFYETTKKIIHLPGMVMVTVQEGIGQFDTSSHLHFIYPDISG